MDPDLIVIITTLLFSAFLSGIEIAFISSNRLKIELDRTRGSVNGRIVGYFYKKEGHFITTLLLANNTALVLLGIGLAKMLAPAIQSWGIRDYILVVFIQTILSTLLVLTIGEFFPKAIFRLNPNGFLKTLAVPMFFLYWILYIPTAIIMFVSIGLLRLLRIDVSDTEKVFSKIDLEHYVQDLNERLKEEEEFGNEMQILQNALDFSKIKARDCMVPRPEIIGIEINEEIPSLHRIFVETGISKVLIYRDNIDNVIGYVHSFEMFRRPKAINQVMRPVTFVPAAIPGKELLEMFTKQSANIAVVVDEYGGTAGVVTIEDVIEEIFGDIEDEHDNEDWLEEKISDTEYRFSARAEIDYLNEQYKLSLPESDEYETLGGWIIHLLESIPEAGTRVESGDYTLIIEQVSDRRIEIVRLEVES